MAVIEFVTSNEFIPTWQGNAEKDDPIVVVYETPTTKLYKQLIKRPIVRMQTDAKGAVTGGVIDIEVDYAPFVVSMVKQVKNLSFTVNGGLPQTISNGSDFYKAGVPAPFRELADEIGEYLKGVLEAGNVDIKK